jgi:hypothetical protein
MPWASTRIFAPSFAFVALLTTAAEEPPDVGVADDAGVLVELLELPPQAASSAEAASAGTSNFTV